AVRHRGMQFMAFTRHKGLYFVTHYFQSGVIEHEVMAQQQRD
ncbi:hypothetical protein PSYJA_44211, partial [Pseudomonas syringae pv. japonica str. M301072]